MTDVLKKEKTDINTDTQGHTPRDDRGKER